MSEKQTDQAVSQADAAAALDGTPATNGNAQSKAAAQEQGPDLTIQDLQAIKSIIDVASERGSFKANEMMTVGTVYNKLETFLNAVANQQKSQGA